MKILHTADWHLGHRFLNNERTEEHKKVLDHLIKIIEDEHINCLIVAGDIFDVVNPTNTARALYFDFLRALIRTKCRHIVIIGGNHDSPTMLEAPKALLEAFSIHVVGHTPSNILDEIIEFKDKNGQIELVIAAVPFLRDRDLIQGESGQNYTDKLDKIRGGIKAHYTKLAEEIKQRQYGDIPIIATGHLFATGAKTSDKQNNIYIGNMDNISGDAFPPLFDYVALGHIHRSQRIGGLEHIRYAGSIIPKTFKETADKKSITIVDFKGKTIDNISIMPLPIYRPLMRLKCTAQNWSEVLNEMNDNIEKMDGLRPWVEIKLDINTGVTHINDEIRKYVHDMNFDVLKIGLVHPSDTKKLTMEMLDLSDMSINKIFEERLKETSITKEEKQRYIEMHHEIIESLNIEN